MTADLLCQLMIQVLDLFWHDVRARSGSMGPGSTQQLKLQSDFGMVPGTKHKQI